MTSSCPEQLVSGMGRMMEYVNNQKNHFCDDVCKGFVYYFAFLLHLAISGELSSSDVSWVYDLRCSWSIGNMLVKQYWFIWALPLMSAGTWLGCLRNHFAFVLVKC